MMEVKVREAVEAYVLKLNPVGGIDHLLEEVQPIKAHRNELLKMKAQYLNAKKDYMDGLASLKQFNKFKDRFNDLLLNMLDDLDTIPPDVSESRLEAELIEFSKRQITLRIYNGSSFNLMVFRTNYVMNRLFVENRFFGNARIMRKIHFWKFPNFWRKPLQKVDNVEILDSDLAADTDNVVQNKASQPLKVLNLLGYHKRFPFVLKNGKQEGKYVLVVNFSIYSGLIKEFSLRKGDKILLESSL